LLARLGDEAKLLAGGQSLVPMMAMRLLRPAWLVDINEIRALKFISVQPDFARIGACTRQMVLERDDALAAGVPLIRQALAFVGHLQTRNRGTIGGSLAHADPSAELPLVAQVLGARMLLQSSKGARTVKAEEFFTGAMSTAIRPDEDEAAKAAAAECEPSSDLHASADYRRHLARVLAGRALRGARTRCMN
jgi:CO/xanthine dehydrogenase FAD-binding subunit